MCLRNKPKNQTKEKMVITETPQKPFDVVVIDTIGPLRESESKNLYALTIICDLSKYLIMVPMKTKTAAEVAKAIFEKLILVHGPMKVMLSDMGTEINNELIVELCKLFTIKHKTSTPHHHETVGSIERSHRTFNEYIRAYLTNEMENWDVYANYFSFCYNITPHGSNNNLYGPFELVYGRKINMPNDFLSGNVQPLYNVDNYVKTMKFMLQTAHQKTAKIIDIMKMRNKKQYDKTANSICLNVGDSVLLKKEPYNKHDQIYSGPHLVTKIEEPNALISIDNKSKLVHKNRLVKVKSTL